MHFILNRNCFLSDELLVPAIQPIRLQDVDEKDDYDKDFNAECSKWEHFTLITSEH